MAIEDTLRVIRNKPESVRIAYVAVFITVVMTLIIVLWVFSLRVSLQDIVQDMRNATLPPDDAQQLRSISDAIRQSADVTRSASDLAEKTVESIITEEKSTTLTPDREAESGANNEEDPTVIIE